MSHHTPERTRNTTAYSASSTTGHSLEEASFIDTEIYRWGYIRLQAPQILARGFLQGTNRSKQACGSN